MKRYSIKRTRNNCKKILLSTIRIHSTFNKKNYYEYPPSYLTYGRPDRTGRSKNIQALPGTVKLGNKELFDKEQIGIKEPFPVTNLPFTS